MSGNKKWCPDGLTKAINELTDQSTHSISNIRESIALISFAFNQHNIDTEPYVNAFIDLEKIYHFLGKLEGMEKQKEIPK
ncbi:MAG: hypothetical protein AAF985_26725 [Bacteroidota bacterium]